MKSASTPSNSCRNIQNEQSDPLPLRCRSVAAPFDRTIDRRNDTPPPPPPPLGITGSSSRSSSSSSSCTSNAHETRSEGLADPSMDTECCCIESRHGRRMEYGWTLTPVANMDNEVTWQRHARSIDALRSMMHAIEAWKTHGARMGTDNCCHTQFARIARDTTPAKE